MNDQLNSFKIRGKVLRQSQEYFGGIHIMIDVNLVIYEHVICSAIFVNCSF